MVKEFAQDVKLNRENNKSTTKVAKLYLIASNGGFRKEAVIQAAFSLLSLSQRSSSYILLVSFLR
jgi:hypothetical protein